MESCSQNSEDLFVLDYFGEYRGKMLEIGSNDGVTLSNSRLLIEQGWSAVLVEPGETYKKLYARYKGNEQVQAFNFGIGERDEIVNFWESAAHVPGGSDRGLVSTANFSETLRWPDVEFIKRYVRLKRFDSLVKYAPFDFISIDAEGCDWAILKQIDLEAVGCRCLCIEWNSDYELAGKYMEYCKGYKAALVNGENIIFTK